MDPNKADRNAAQLLFFPRALPLSLPSSSLELLYKYEAIVAGAARGIA